MKKVDRVHKKRSKNKKKTKGKIPVKIKRKSISILFSLIDHLQLSIELSNIMDGFNMVRLLALLLGGLVFGLVEIILLLLARCLYFIVVLIILATCILKNNRLEFVFIGSVIFFVIYFFKRDKK